LRKGRYLLLQHYHSKYTKPPCGDKYLSYACDANPDVVCADREDQRADGPEVTMDCPNCSAPQPEGGRFCARCGTSLHGGIDRGRHFAARPDEPVRTPALMSTLMPHLSGGRLNVYADVIALALLASLVAAAFGLLSVALVFAAVALPAAVLVYIQDHGVWRGDPLSSIGLGLILALLLGVGIGLVQRYYAAGPVLGSTTRRVPAPMTLLNLGVLVPVVTFIALLIVPLIVTSRARMKNTVDTVVICTLSGAALSLGYSVVVQLGAFTHVTYGDPTQAAFIALTLGVVQPVIFATAAAVTVMQLRRKGSNTLAGLVKGVLLLVIYGLGTTILTPYGTRGVVLTTVLVLLVAAAGLVLARMEMHTALLAEAQAAVDADGPAPHAPAADLVCSHCRVMISAGAAFCPSCGTATAALSNRAAAKAAK
jgi:hypothetical protein